MAAGTSTTSSKTQLPATNRVGQYSCEVKDLGAGSGGGRAQRALPSTCMLENFIIRVIPIFLTDN